jgi:hypothetical protein
VIQLHDGHVTYHDMGSCQMHTIQNGLESPVLRMHYTLYHILDILLQHIEALLISWDCCETLNLSLRTLGDGEKSMIRGTR